MVSPDYMDNLTPQTGKSLQASPQSPYFMKAKALHLRGKDFRRVVTIVTVCDDWMLAGDKASECERAPT